MTTDAFSNRGFSVPYLSVPIRNVLEIGVKSSQAEALPHENGRSRRPHGGCLVRLIDRPRMFPGPRLFACAVGILLLPLVCRLEADGPGDEVKVPAIAGQYVTVYRPAGDRFPGPDTPQLKAGQFYRDWVPNDHAIIQGLDQRWHAIGITHPLTTTDSVHEGEYQSFHAVAPAGRLSDVWRDSAWRDEPKILPPAERPGEILEHHAPFIIRRGDEYVMVYGPSPLRWATSPDLSIWKPHGTLLSTPPTGRDPHVLLWQDRYYLLYCVEDRVDACTSADLVNWSPPRTILRMPQGVAPESPTLVRCQDTFFLFVCGWDGIWDRQTIQGAYQHVTYVYQSDDPMKFPTAQEIARLAAHAPEVFRDEQGDWFISSAEWPARGVSIARLEWR